MPNVVVQERDVCRFLLVSGVCKLGHRGGAVEPATVTEKLSENKTVVDDPGKYLCVYRHDSGRQPKCSTFKKFSAGN